MAAIKPINLAVALEPTSGPAVPEDPGRTVEEGGLGWTGTLMFPSVRSLSKTHTHNLVPSQVHTGLMSAGCAVLFFFCYK